MRTKPKYLQTCLEIIITSVSTIQFFNYNFRNFQQKSNSYYNNFSKQMEYNIRKCVNKYYKYFLLFKLFLYFLLISFITSLNSEKIRND